MKRFLIALFALCSFFAQAQTFETPTGWNSTSYYFRPDAQNPKRVPKSYLAGPFSVVVSSSYTTKGDEYVSCWNTANMVLTLGQATDYFKGKFITVADGIGTASASKYIEIRSHDTTAVKIDGVGRYRIENPKGLVTLLCTGTGWTVVNTNTTSGILLVHDKKLIPYKTIYAANTAAVAEDVIFLTDNIKLDSTLNLKSNVSLNANGKTITVPQSGVGISIKAGTASILNVKEINGQAGTDAQNSFPFFQITHGAVVNLDIDKVTAGKYPIIITDSTGTNVVFSAKQVDAGTYSTYGIYAWRKFFAIGGSNLRVLNATITDQATATNPGWIGSVVRSGSVKANAADTLRSVLEFRNCTAKVSRGFAFCERLGELIVNNCKIKTGADQVLNISGDPYFSNAAVEHHYNVLIVKDCYLENGASRFNASFDAPPVIQSSATWGAIETDYQNIYFYGENNIISNSPLANCIWGNTSRYPIRNYGTLWVNKPSYITNFLGNKWLVIGDLNAFSGGGGAGVISVGATSPLSSSGGNAPVISFPSQSANTVLAGPNGSSGSPGFRALVADDIPTLAWTKITSTPTTLSGYGITDGLPNTRTLTINSVTYDLTANRTWTVGDVQTSGSYSNPSWITSLAASKISSILSIAQGGTGAGTQVAALTALLPSQSGNSGKVLQTDGTNATWQTAGGGGGGISGSGTTGKYLKWASSSSATDAIISDDGSKVTIDGGADAFLAKSSGSGVTQQLEQTSNNDVLFRYKRNGGSFWDIRYYYTGEGLKFRYNDADKFTLNTDGSASLTGAFSASNISGTNTGDQTSVTGNAGTATILATARGIYGNNFDGSAALTQIISSVYGGTGSGFTKFAGPTTSEKTFTMPNASATVLTDNAAVTIAQGGTGATTQQAAINALTGTQTNNYILRSNGTNASLSAMAEADLAGYAAQAYTTYSGTIVWDGTAPTGASHSYGYYKIGKLVSGWIRLEYSSGGATNTNVTCSLSGFPTPSIPTGVGTGENGLACSGYLATSASANPVASRAWLYEDSGIWKLKILAASNGYQLAFATFSYLAN